MLELMKRTFFVLSALVWSLTSLAQFSGQGTGLNNDPYQITNADQLFEVRNDLTANYKLMNDINLGEWLAQFSPVQGWSPIGNESSPFIGTFDGNHKTIKGLYINRPSMSYIGLFGFISGATIKNINIVGINIKGNANTSVLVGGAKGEVGFEIDNNVCIGGVVTGNDNVGCILGMSNYNMTNKRWPSTVTRKITGNYCELDIYANSCCGGIVGNIDGGFYRWVDAYNNVQNTVSPTITDNVFHGRINSKSNAGGIVGTIHTVNSCSPYYNVCRNIAGGAYYADDSLNGIAGSLSDGESSYKSCNFEGNFCVADTLSCVGGVAARISKVNKADNYAYSDMIVLYQQRQLSIEDNNFNGTGYSRKLLQRKNTYQGQGFDFSKQWSIIDGVTFPFNINQSQPAEIVLFSSGTKGHISGTAQGTGIVYILIDNILYESYVVDNNWDLILGNTPSDIMAKVYVSMEGKSPSIGVSSVAQEIKIDPIILFGDANGDGVVDAADVTAIINYIMGKPSASFNKANADVTGDGEILIDDAVNTVQMIMDKQ